MRKLLLLHFILSTFILTLQAQPTFQGEIRYALRYQFKKKPAYVVAYPAKQLRFIIKDGNFILHMDTAKDYAYQYFDRNRKKQYWKLRVDDTLVYMPITDSSLDPGDNITSVQNLKHVDTVLGRVCNRFVLRTTKMKLSLSYDPSIPVDPAWFRDAKLNAMDLVYGTMKSMYLKMVWETNDFVETATATKIERRLVLPSEFPPVDAMPQKRL